MSASAPRGPMQRELVFAGLICAIELSAPLEFRNGTGPL